MANTAVVYGRDYSGKTLNFEASGGLTNASLVMQDKETNTYWSLMQGEALKGEMKGQTLNELSIGEKSTWKEWRAKHPTTKVLSVDSKEDGKERYKKYFSNKDGYKGMQSSDQRLETKASIFAFRHADKPYAIPYSESHSGETFLLPDGSQVFLYRDKEDNLFRSTSVFISKDGFVKQGGKWSELTTKSEFDEATRTFGDGVERLKGFDTFWYNWSLNNPETAVLAAENTKGG